MLHIKESMRTWIQKYKDSDIVYKSSIWFVMVSVIDQAISILTQPILNRILSVDQIGIYSVYNTWHSIFLIITTCNLFGGILEVYITKFHSQRQQVICSLHLLCLIIFCIFTLIGTLFLSPIMKITGLKKSYLELMALSIVSTAVIQFWCVPKRFEYAYKQYAVLIVSLFFFKCTLSIILAYAFKTDPLLGRILGMVIPPFSVAVIVILKLLSVTNFKKITQYWKSALNYNLPLLPHYLAAVLLSSSDRIMIQKICGDYEAGLYAIVYAYSTLSLIVFNALNSAYTPFAYNAIMHEKYTELERKTKNITKISVAFSVVLMMLAPEGIEILGGQKFRSAVDIIPVLIIGIYLSSFYYIFSNVEFVNEVTKYVFPITIIGTGINIILNYVLIPQCGYKIAAYTTVIGYSVIAVLHGLIANRIVKKDIYHLKSLIRIIAAFMCIGGGMIFLYRINLIIRYLLYCLGVILVCCLYKYRRKI